MRKIAVVFAALVLLAASAMAAPLQLQVNGTNLLGPMVGPGSDLTMQVPHAKVVYNLLFEETPLRDMNTFGFYTDLGAGLKRTTIFDDNQGVGAISGFEQSGKLGFFLFSDIGDGSGKDPAADNDKFDGGTLDKMLFSQLALGQPSVAPQTSHQWFRAYNVKSFGQADFSFDGLRFSGNYDYLLFIDDGYDASPNFDHNDMVVGMTVLPMPEPTTLVLLGMGLTAVGIFRRRK